MRTSIVQRSRFIWASLLVALFLAVPGQASAQALLDAGTPDASEAPETDRPIDDTEPEGDRVTEVRVEGALRVEAEAIRRALLTQAGQPFNPANTSEDLRRLYALGYFSDIRLLVQRLPQGLVYVVRVEERPAIREVKLRGNEELSEEDLKGTVDLKTGSILNLDAVRRNAQKIQEKYVEKGYFLAEVSYLLEPTPQRGTIDVVFVIDENAKVMVREIRFIGNKTVSDGELKAVMATREGGLLSFITGEGTYREELFQRDLAVVQGVYYDRGFINVKVEKPVVSLSANKRDIFISIQIEEGEQFRIGELDFSGDLIVEREVLQQKMTSEEGELFNRSSLSRDILAITDIYLDQGYAYANITPVNRIDNERKLIDLTFDIQKGKQVTIERIEIVGNTKTRDKVIRRELRIYEGELFSGTGLRLSRDRVQRLGFFETVEVSQRPGSADDRIVVQVEVKEKPTGTFQVGLGFSNVENFIFTAQVAQQNFLGYGQALAASAQLSSLRNLVQVSYTDPYFLDTNFILSADFYRVEADYLGFIRESLGGNATLGYQFLDGDLAANVTYTREYVNVQPGRDFDQEIPLANQFRSGLTSSMRLSLTYDKRDNRLFPSKGHVQFASVEYAPPLLGGTFLFARYSAYSRFYFPLPFGFVFKTNANLGYIQQLDPAQPLPISELYYLGGINTLRGYLLRSISPTVLVGSSARPDAGVREFNVGGDKQATFNLELEFPIFESIGIRGVLFYDAGNTWGVTESFFQDRQEQLPLDMFHSVGFGFRWFSPIGPLRFEWGVPLTPRPNDQPLLFEFTIGNFF